VQLTGHQSRKKEEMFFSVQPTGFIFLSMHPLEFVHLIGINHGERRNVFSLRATT
jgi:hypothetical protein